MDVKATVAHLNQRDCLDLLKKIKSQKFRIDIAKHMLGKAVDSEGAKAALLAIAAEGLIDKVDVTQAVSKLTFWHLLTLLKEGKVAYAVAKSYLPSWMMGGANDL